MRKEVADSNVRFIVIAPGVVETPLLSHTSDQEIKDNYNIWKKTINGGLDTGKIADCVLFAYNMPQDKYKFKVPSLRNIEKTAPYMHDGRFYTLEAVLNHYSNGVQNNLNLDSSLNTNGTLGIPLTNDQKTKIIAFLKTLTDQQFLTDSRFAEY
jgi:cytochrome c peroxidase